MEKAKKKKKRVKSAEPGKKEGDVKHPEDPQYQTMAGVTPSVFGPQATQNNPQPKTQSKSPWGPLGPPEKKTPGSSAQEGPPNQAKKPGGNAKPGNDINSNYA